jgi:hypothetical protein
MINIILIIANIFMFLWIALLKFDDRHKSQEKDYIEQSRVLWRGVRDADDKKETLSKVRPQGF